MAQQIPCDICTEEVAVQMLTNLTDGSVLAMGPACLPQFYGHSALTVMDAGEHKGPAGKCQACRRMHERMQTPVASLDAPASPGDAGDRTGHGRRSRRPVTWPRRRQPPVRMDTSSALAVTTCIGSILLPAGHRMRAARCLICEDLIAGRPVTIIGIAALDGDACKCGSVISDAYLCHAEHLPVATEMLQQAIQTALTCTLDHSAHW